MTVQLGVFPDDVHSLKLVVALRSIDDASAMAFWSGELDDDLLCYPLVKGRGAQTFTVPSGRRLWLACIARSTYGERVGLDALTIIDGGANSAGALDMSGHAHTQPLNDEIPLTFVEGDAAPNLAKLARRMVLGGVRSKPISEALPRGGSFGGRQRWTMLRLGWEAQPAGLIWVIRRESPIADSDVAQWLIEPPTDALCVDGEHDGLIDALTPPDAFGFFVVLRAAHAHAAREVVPLSVVPPPFDRVRRPLHIGPVVQVAELAITHLIAQIGQGGALRRRAAELELLDALAQSLPDGHPMGQEVSACIAANQRGKRF